MMPLIISWKEKFIESHMYSVGARLLHWVRLAVAGPDSLSFVPAHRRWVGFAHIGVKIAVVGSNSSWLDVGLHLQ